MVAVTLILASAVFVFLLIWYIVYSVTYKRVINKLDGPPALPLIGNTHQLQGNGGDFFKLIDEYYHFYEESGLFRLWLAESPRIILTRADTIEPVLKGTKHTTKSTDYDVLHPWLGTGLLTSAGEKWKSRRRLLTPTFHFKILQDFVDVFNDQTDIMVQKLSHQTGKEAFDIFPYVTACALDIICETAMGHTVNAQNNHDSDYVKAVYKVSELVHVRQKSPWLWPDVIYDNIPSGKEFKRCLGILHNFTQKVIEERQEQLSQQLSNKPINFSLTDLVEDSSEHQSHLIGGSKRLAFLDMLLYAAEGGSKLSFKDIQEEVDTFMFEGHDTTAAAITWSTYLIGSHPEIQQRLHEEMDSIFGSSDRKATADDLQQMKYLSCTIKEALRIYPSVPFFARQLTEDCTIGGHWIPKDTQVIILTTGVHSDPKQFPNPEKFDPDRFLPENKAKLHPYAYIPFSAGMRNCIGQKFAMMEEKVLLSSILRKFNIESVQRSEQVRPVCELILRPEQGIGVKLTARK